jgi:pyruvate dehydrogenase E1 component beta subunit
VVVVQEAQKQAGVGAMVVSEISERAVLSLEAPIGRVSAPDTIFPFGQAENIWLPNAKDIEAKARDNASLFLCFLNDNHTASFFNRVNNCFHI